MNESTRGFLVKHLTHGYLAGYKTERRYCGKFIPRRLAKIFKSLVGVKAALSYGPSYDYLEKHGVHNHTHYYVAPPRWPGYRAIRDKWLKEHPWEQWLIARGYTIEEVCITPL